MDKDQEAFEQYAPNTAEGFSIEKHNGRYIYHPTEIAWKIWRAACAYKDKMQKEGIDAYIKG